MSTLRILLTGKIEGGGDIQWQVPPLPVDDEAADGKLQQTIDYGAELQELLDWREDEEFNRRGC